MKQWDALREADTARVRQVHTALQLGVLLAELRALPVTVYTGDGAKDEADRIYGEIEQEAGLMLAPADALERFREEIRDAIHLESPLDAPMLMEVLRG